MKRPDIDLLKEDVENAEANPFEIHPYAADMTELINWVEYLENVIATQIQDYGKEMLERSVE